MDDLMMQPMMMQGMAFGGPPLPPAPPACASFAMNCPPPAPAPGGALFCSPPQQQQQQQPQQQQGRFNVAPSTSTGGGLFGATNKVVSTEPLVQQPQTNVSSESPQEPADQDALCCRDYTQVPIAMDRRFEQCDTDGAVRPTIITPGATWTKRAQKALLAKPTTSSCGTDEQKQEKDAAFDLLDALTKSGALSIKHASLHIIVAATHCFDKSVTETVVQNNINPIEKVERSALVMASTVHQVAVGDLIQESQKTRLANTSPMLFLE